MINSDIPIGKKIAHNALYNARGWATVMGVNSAKTKSTRVMGVLAAP
jgi:hypothetical protein